MFVPVCSIVSQPWCADCGLPPCCALRPAQAQGRGARREAPVTLSSAQAQLDTLQWGELSVNQRTINQLCLGALFSVRCRTDDGTCGPQSRYRALNAADRLNVGFSHQFHEPHFNTDTALMLNTVVCLDIHASNIKLKLNLLTNKCGINLLNSQARAVSIFHQMCGVNLKSASNVKA